jgi:hypothetical protein
MTLADPGIDWQVWFKRWQAQQSCYVPECQYSFHLMLQWPGFPRNARGVHPQPRLRPGLRGLRCDRTLSEGSGAGCGRRSGSAHNETEGSWVPGLSNPVNSSRHP